MKPATNSAATAAAVLLLCAALLLPANVHAQQSAPASPELQQVLDRLGAAAQSLQRSLPSITCVESGVSETFKKKKVKKRVTFTATMRAIRTPGGLDESFTLTKIHPKQYFRLHDPFPLFSKGGFDSALAYFLPSQQPCYVYALSPGRIDFATIEDAAFHPPCHADGTRGFALFDAGGNVTHIERSVPEQSMHDFNLTPFVAIDFAPVELNGKTYRLSQHVVSELYEDDDTRRFEATYSGCRLFTATVTILPPTQVVPDGAQPPAGP
jgi:hypothetical protein